MEPANTEEENQNTHTVNVEGEAAREDHTENAETSREEADIVRQLDDELPSVSLVRGRSRRCRTVYGGTAGEARQRTSFRGRSNSDSRSVPLSDVVVSNTSAVQSANGVTNREALVEIEASSNSREKDAVPNKLHDRLVDQRNETRRLRMAKTSLLEDFIHNKWPKLKRKLTAWRALELWRRHMKYISSHYGSGVYSYYNFLRWLFLVNIVLGLILTVFLVIPQFLWRARVEGKADRERILDTAYRCIDNTHLHNGTTCTAGCVPVYDDCDAANSTVDVPECRLVNPPGSPLLRVTVEMICKNDSNQTQCLCPRRIPFFQGLLDFINGEGLFATSELFIGWYTHTLIGGVYDMPVAYLLVWGFVYVLSLLMIAARIGSSFREHYIYNSKLIVKSRRNVCNRVFTGWDFNIIGNKSAEKQHRSVKRRLKELAGELTNRQAKRERKDSVKITLIRIVTNTFVLLSLVAGGVAIWFAVDAELRLVDTSLLSTAVITVVNLLLPKIYTVLVDIEKYQSPRTAVFISTLRFLVVRLFSYITLIISVIAQINCTQPDPGAKGTECTLDFSDTFQAIAFGREEESCPSCWETVIGQKFYANAVVNIIASVIGTIVFDVLQNLVSRVKWPIIGNYFSREFDVPENIIDLMETQIIFWLGSFFCPMISIILVLHLLILFYVKRYSMQLNLEPSKDLYLAAKKDLGFLFILLFTGLVCIVPVGYAIARLVPSSSCSPFRRSSFIYSVIEDRIEELNCSIQAIVGFIVSSSFLVILILFLMLVCLGLILVLYAKSKHVDLLVKQFKSESLDKSYFRDVAVSAKRQLLMYEHQNEGSAPLPNGDMSLQSAVTFSVQPVVLESTALQSPTSEEEVDTLVIQNNVGMAPPVSPVSRARRVRQHVFVHPMGNTLDVSHRGNGRRVSDVTPGNSDTWSPGQHNGTVVAVVSPPPATSQNEVSTPSQRQVDTSL